MLSWCNRFNICCFLDSQQYPSSLQRFECLLAAGSIHSLKLQAGDDVFLQLRAFHEKHADWIFGHLGYDLKNGLEPLVSEHPDGIGFPDLFFFVPEVIVQLNEDTISIGSVHTDHEQVYQDIMATQPPILKPRQAGLAIHQRLERDEYLQVIRDLQQHILRGDCYEINYCQEFYATDVVIDPLSVCLSLGKLRPTLSRLFTNWRIVTWYAPARALPQKGRGPAVLATDQGYLAKGHFQSGGRCQETGSSYTIAQKTGRRM